MPKAFRMDIQPPNNLTPTVMKRRGADGRNHDDNKLPGMWMASTEGSEMIETRSDGQLSFYVYDSPFINRADI